MLNLRQIDNKFWLSGGWTDVPEDARWLRNYHFKAVLDLQFTRDNYTPKSAAFIADALLEESIEYFAIPMNDGENPNIEFLFDAGYNQLSAWDAKYTKTTDKILIKCGVGVSRSVAMLIYYYCVRDRLTYSEAKAKIARKDNLNYAGLPISIDQILEIYLKTMFPDISSTFGVLE